MYYNNDLISLARQLKSDLSDIELDTEYKTELFQTHIKAATSHLESAGQLAGNLILPKRYNYKEVTIALIVFVIMLLILMVLN